MFIFSCQLIRLRSGLTLKEKHFHEEYMFASSNVPGIPDGIVNRFDFLFFF